jgi:hypothetical protein
MSDARSTLSFTQAVAELDEAGFDSMGFAFEDEQVLCVDCGHTMPADEVKVGGLLGYQTEDGDGLVLVLACSNCAAKGMLFAGPQVIAGPNGPQIDQLASRARG